MSPDLSRNAAYLTKYDKLEKLAEFYLKVQSRGPWELMHTRGTCPFNDVSTRSHNCKILCGTFFSCAAVIPKACPCFKHGVEKSIDMLKDLLVSEGFIKDDD